MVGKPFSIQAPEEIAKEYGGNKQKIAQAAQLGVVDPTAALLAGMFIDRMRSAQVQEMTPQQSVAQQVMGGVGSAPAAGPPVAGGLGALPPEAPPMAPPPMAPPGMAEGGYYAGGGLGDLSVPDTMFDEPENGGYGGGGIVAFAGGTPGKAAPIKPDPYNLMTGLEDIVAQLTQGGGSMTDPQYQGLAALRERLASTPAQLEKQRKEDKWMALAQLGASLASSKSPYFLQALGEAGTQALPMIAESSKERRAAEREAIRDQAQLDIQELGLKGKARETAINIQANNIRNKIDREKLDLERSLGLGRLGLGYAQLDAMREHNAARIAAAANKPPTLSAGERQAQIVARRIASGLIDPKNPKERSLYEFFRSAVARGTDPQKAALPLLDYAYKTVSAYGRDGGIDSLLPKEGGAEPEVITLEPFGDG